MIWGTQEPATNVTVSLSTQGTTMAVLAGRVGDVTNNSPATHLAVKTAAQLSIWYLSNLPTRLVGIDARTPKQQITCEPTSTSIRVNPNNPARAFKGIGHVSNALALFTQEAQLTKITWILILTCVIVPPVTTKPLNSQESEICIA